MRSALSVRSTRPGYIGKSLLSSSAASAVVVMWHYRVGRASRSRAAIASAPPRRSHPRADSLGLKRATTNVTSESVEYFAESSERDSIRSSEHGPHVDPAPSPIRACPCRWEATRLTLGRGQLTDSRRTFVMRATDAAAAAVAMKQR
ncbi:hypothetical protein MTO96_020357 [Rhipicephalus appendiculatus]